MKNNRRQLTQNLVDAIHRAKTDGSAWVNYGSFRFKLEPWNNDLSDMFHNGTLKTKNHYSPILIIPKKGHLWAVESNMTNNDKGGCLLGSNIAVFPSKNVYKGKVRAFVSECHPRT